MDPKQLKAERFAFVYNDAVRYPTLEDVSSELGLSYSSVKNIAGTFRRRRNEGEDVPELTYRKPRLVTLDQVRRAEKGELGFDPVLPGFAIKKVSTTVSADGRADKSHVQQVRAPGEVFEIPAGHVAKGVSALLDPDGRVLQRWVKTREEFGLQDTVEIVREAFREFEGRAEPVPEPLDIAADTLNLFPCNDWHVGMYSWGQETDANWDTTIAERVIGRSVDQVIERAPRCGTAIVLGGGDLLHADNQENKTARSGNPLDVDGRYPKVLMSACRLMVRTVDAALRRNGRVLVKILPGNHDEHAAVAVSYFLAAWFRAEPRVTVNVDPGVFFWHRFGLVMLGATHGHTVKLKDMAGIMAHRRAKDWGDTTYRYVHGFHIHHTEKVATEGNGVIAESHQAPVPQDAWHYASGFLSGRSLTAITYHKSYGEISRARVAIIDDCSVAPITALAA